MYVLHFDIGVYNISFIMGFELSSDLLTPGVLIHLWSLSMYIWLIIFWFVNPSCTVIINIYIYIYIVCNSICMMSMLHQFMGPGAYETLETLQFTKFNGTNYHVWSDNMKAALQAKSLWGVVSGRELCLPVPPSMFPELAMETSLSSETTLSSIKKEDWELIRIFQSEEYRAWDLANKKFKHWLNKDDAAMGLVCNTIELIVSSKTSKLMWDQLKKDYVDLQSRPNIHFYYQ